MSDKQLRTLILLGLAGVAVWYVVSKSGASANQYVPGPVNITPINPGLLPPSPTDTTHIQPGSFMPGSFMPGFVSGGSVLPWNL
jgi:hypothetical protein